MFKATVLATALLMAGLAQAQSGPGLALSPSASSVPLGGSFSVDLLITGVVDLYSWEVALGFSPASRVSATAQATGSFFGAADLFVPGAVDNAAGTITGTASTLFGPAGVSGNGQLARFSFTALSLGVATFNLTAVLLGNSNLDPIFTSNANWVSGQVTVVPEPAGSALAVFGLLGVLAVVKRGRTTVRVAPARHF